MDHHDSLVITGTGVVCPSGVGNDAFWAALMEGRSSVRQLESLQTMNVRPIIGAEVRGYDPKEHVKPRKSLKVMSREIQFGFAAAALAMQDAGLAAEALDPDRVGVVFASEMLYCGPEELLDTFRDCCDQDGFHHERWGRSAMANVYPLWMLKYLPNMAACHLGIAFDARGPNNSITVGEASSLLALIEAADVILRGDADVMIVGGVGNRLNISTLVARSTDVLSHREQDPGGACRPFDADRDGMVNGEGAGAMILERGSHARSRGARIRARWLGYGRSFHPRDNGGPMQPDGVRRAIQAALASSGSATDDIDHVNAHGLSTLTDDRAEALAIASCLGETPVTAPKSYFGNLGASGGLVEGVASILAFQEQRVPATLNYEHPDPECPVRVVCDPSARLHKPLALLLNHSGTGQTAAVMLERP